MFTVHNIYKIKCIYRHPQDLENVLLYIYIGTCISGYRGYIYLYIGCKYVLVKILITYDMPLYQRPVILGCTLYIIAIITQ